MKIYNKVVIDIETGVILEEDSYEYEGPVARAFGGGSSGGGESGTRDWPEYMKYEHNVMLADNYSIIQAEINSGTPGTYLYDPRVWLGYAGNYTTYYMVDNLVSFAPQTMLQDFFDPVSSVYIGCGYDRQTTRAALIDGLWTDYVVGTTVSTAISAMIDEFTTKLFSKYEAEVEPRIEVGFRDAGAVVGTSFTIAKAIALRDYQREVSDFTAKAHMRYHDLKADLLKTQLTIEANMTSVLLDNALKRGMMSMEHLKLGASLYHDTAAALTEALGKYSVLQTADAMQRKKWKLDLLEYMNKTLASISGITPVSSNTDRGSGMFTSMIGMGLTGASTGAYIGSVMGAGGGAAAGAGGGAATGAAMGMAGGPVGAIIGGVIGLGLGALGALGK